ncbi:MAG TPA: phosphoribosyltransferase family protein [Nitrososphaerales archaeon]|nr:phosphoribosyltransferase family protein [Nitrososphaerales archaeon]
MLSAALADFKADSGVVVLAIPRGGVFVAREVARALGLELDIIVTRKIGAPGDPELAVGAVTQEGEIVVDRRLADLLQVSERYVKAEASKELEEIERRVKVYRGTRPRLEIAGKTVIIVDDGIATGSTMKAAAMSARTMKASNVVIAAPVASPEAVRELSEFSDKIVCLSVPEGMVAIGEFYDTFEQADDVAVRRTLEEGD